MKFAVFNFCAVEPASGKVTLREFTAIQVAVTKRHLVESTFAERQFLAAVQPVDMTERNVRKLSLLVEFFREHFLLVDGFHEFFGFHVV